MKDFLTEYNLQFKNSSVVCNSGPDFISPILNGERDGDGEGERDIASGVVKEEDLM